MIRHFLGAFFFGFIGFVVFINLFQYSGAVVPFDMPFDEYNSPNNSIFGFTSIINFVQNIADDTAIDLALKSIRTAFSIIQDFSINQIVQLFVNVRNIQTGGFGFVVAVILGGLISIIITGLVQPFVFFFAFIILIFGVFLFLWQIISIFFKFALGYYNYVPITSGILNNINYVPPVLQATSFVLV